MYYLIHWDYFVIGYPPSYKVLQNPTKMTIPPIFSYNHTLNCLKMLYLLQSTFFYFHGLKFIFIFCWTIKQKDCYLIDIYNSKHIITISSFIHLSKSVLIIFCTPIGGSFMCNETTILSSKFSAACDLSSLCVSSHLTNTFPLMMLDFRSWHIWSTYWRTVTAIRLQT